jgi:hypothetical protein
MAQETEEDTQTREGASVGFHPAVPHTPSDEIVELWFEAVAQLRNHTGLAREMAKLQPWADCGLTKPILPLPESEEEQELHLYTQFPELTTAMDMMVQWDKEVILGIVDKPQGECNSFVNKKIYRLRALGVGLYVGPQDEDGRMVALDMGGFYA